MNLKNISKLKFLFFIFLSILLVSCSERKEIISKIDNLVLEKKDSIEIGNYNKTRKSFDYYNRNINPKWNNSKKLKKYLSISTGKLNNSPENIFNYIIVDDYVYYINNKYNFIKYDLLKKEIISKVQLFEKNISDFNIPISLLKNNEFFYLSFGNGTIIKIDSDGSIYWKKKYKDIIRTPMIMINNNIIVIFNSGKVLSINSENGNTVWEYNYNLNKPSLSTGGEIHLKYNLIYFIMPNGRIGVIDNIVGEPIDYNFVSNIEQKNILNFNYYANLHIYENILSLIEDESIINTYDLNNDDFFIYDKNIYTLKSSFYLNNALLALERNHLLKSFNLKNFKIFWKTDLSKFLSKNDLIKAAYVINKNILIFFTSGKLVQLDKNDGKILFKQDLNIKNINSITVNGQYFVFNSNNEKILFYKQ